MIKIFKGAFGSRLYGTNNDDSDYDYKVVFVPTVEQILLRNYKPAFCIKDKEAKSDTEFWSLDNYIDLILGGQTAAIEILFTPSSHIFCNSDLWRELVKNRDRLLSNKIVGFARYCQKQATRYTLKAGKIGELKEILNILSGLSFNDKLRAFKDKFNPENIIVGNNGEEFLSVLDTMVPLGARVDKAIFTYKKLLENYGDRAFEANLTGGDWKAMAHAYRIASEAIELLQTGKISFPCLEVELIRTIRSGMMDIKTVEEMIQSKLDELSNTKGILSETPDYEYGKSFVLSTYKNIVVKS